MKFPFRLSAIPLLLLLTGCPLQSDHSLGDARSAPMDETLLGCWVDNRLNESWKGSLSLFRFNENEYYIEAVDNENKKTDRYRGYLAVIDNTRILNVQEITDKPSIKMEFMFLKVSLSPDNVLTFWTIEDDLAGEKHISSKSDLLSYIRSHINDSRLYDNVITLIKKGQ